MSSPSRLTVSPTAVTLASGIGLFAGHYTCNSWNTGSRRTIQKMFFFRSERDLCGLAGGGLAREPERMSHNVIHKVSANKQPTVIVNGDIIFSFCSATLSATTHGLQDASVTMY